MLCLRFAKSLIRNRNTVDSPLMKLSLMLSKVRKELAAARVKAAEDHKTAQSSWQTSKAAKVKLRLARKLVKFTKKAANKAEIRAEESLSIFDKIQARLEKLEKRARKELRKHQASAKRKPARHHKPKAASRPKPHHKKVHAKPAAKPAVKTTAKAHKPRAHRPAPRKPSRPAAAPVMVPRETHSPEPVTAPATPTVEAESPDASNSQPANN
jgi:hypothetical protein